MPRAYEQGYDKGPLRMNTFKSTVAGVVIHGATAGTARPTGFAMVIWIGSVEPTNAENNDIWHDTSA